MAEGWHVERTTPTVEVGADGRSREVIRVDFATDKGSRGYVTLPFAEFTAERARDAVEAAVAHVLEVENL